MKWSMQARGEEAYAREIDKTPVVPCQGEEMCYKALAFVLVKTQNRLAVAAKNLRIFSNGGKRAVSPLDMTVGVEERIRRAMRVISAGVILSIWSQRDCGEALK